MPSSTSPSTLSPHLPNSPQKSSRKSKKSDFKGEQWRTEFINSIEYRNQVQSDCFQDIFADYHELQEENKRLNMHISSNSLTQTNSPHSNLTQHNPFTHTLDKFYRNYTENTSDKIDTELLESKIFELRSELERKKTEYSTLHKILDERDKDISEYEYTVINHRKALDALGLEVMELRSQLDITRSTLREVSMENESYIRRLLEYKEKESTVLNELHTLLMYEADIKNQISSTIPRMHPVYPPGFMGNSSKSSGPFPSSNSQQVGIAKDNDGDAYQLLANKLISLAQSLSGPSLPVSSGNLLLGEGLPMNNSSQQLDPRQINSSRNLSTDQSNHHHPPSIFYPPSKLRIPIPTRLVHQSIPLHSGLISACCEFEIRGANSLGLDEILGTNSPHCLLTGGRDGKVSFYDTHNCSVLRQFNATPTGFPIDCMGLLLHERSLLVATSDYTIRLINFETQRQTSSLIAHAASICACDSLKTSPRLCFSMSADRTTRLWDAGRSAQIHSLDVHSLIQCGNSTPQFSQLLACGCKNGNVFVLSTQSNKLSKIGEIPFRGQPIRGLTFTPDSNTIIVLTQYGSLYSVDLRNYKVNQTQHSITKLSPLFAGPITSPDSSSCVVSSGNSLQFFSLNMVDNHLTLQNPPDKDQNKSQPTSKYTNDPISQLSWKFNHLFVSHHSGVVSIWK